MSKHFILILSLFPLLMQAQITGPGSHAVRLTKYPVVTRIDPVFIFCTAAESDRGTLTSASPGGTGPFSFTWMRYDQVAKSYSIPVKTESGTTSTASGLIEGGYSVHITNGGSYDTTLYAWVNLDKPVANAALMNYTCEMVALDGTIATDDFYYYDPSNGVQKKLGNGVSFIWSSIPASSIPNPTIDKDPITYNPPLVDVKYMLQVTDSFGCVSSSSFDFKSIRVKARFVTDPSSGDAPLEVTLTNNSVRAVKYLWEFGDDSVSTAQDPGTHTYYIPGEYKLTLSVESELFCSDDTTATITVLPSELKIPNVFTPNNDDINDFFMPEIHSLRFINVQIFAKSGHRVYYYEGKGEDLQAWTGWDGKINYSDRMAEPGAYFYVIRAIGYDEEVYKGREYRGVVYLYR